MCSNCDPCEFGWSEALPTSCPPSEAFSADGIFYRVVSSVPPTLADFQSYRALDPERSWNVSECQARSISVFVRSELCRKALRLPMYRDGKGKVVPVTLSATAGSLEKKGGHYSWWRCSAFDVLANCGDPVQLASSQ